MTVSPKRMGRRPGDGDTRGHIAQAARLLFSQQGFKATTLRQIAEAAGVDVALIAHYFGSKQGLFDDLTHLPFDAAQVVAELLSGDRDALGERLVLYLLRHLREQPGEQNLVTLLRSSGGHTEIGAAIKKQYVKALMEPLTREIGADQPELRAALCSSQLLGLSFAEQVLGLEALRGTGTQRLARIVGGAVQRYLTGPLET